VAETWKNAEKGLQVQRQHNTELDGEESGLGSMYDWQRQGTA